MTIAAPTLSQIRAQVASIQQKVPEADVIGIRASGCWSGKRIHRDPGTLLVIDQCDSPLAMRIALRQREPDATSVIITSLEQSDLDDDILVRLTKRRLYAVDSWQIVKSLFHAHSIDPRVTQHAWIAEMLLDLIPPEGYAPAPGGFLDADRVWGTLLRSQLGFASGRPDLVAILRWSTEAEAAGRWRSSPESLRVAATDWLIQSAGAVAAPIMDCVAARTTDAVPIGLAGGVVFSRAAGGRLERARGKMEERYFGGLTLAAEALERWHAAATELVRLHLSDVRAKRAILQRADEILNEVGAIDCAYLSETSPAGFDQRLASFGDQLSQQLSAGAGADNTELVAAHDAVLQHDRAQVEDRRIDRTYMAMRLVRWLARLGESTDQRPASLSEAARHHLAEVGFVDWARLALRAGDPVQRLSGAYSALFERVTRECQLQAEAFASLLVDWTAAGSTGGDVIPVENVLESILAPIAMETSVLAIVIDGMSAAVWRELQTDLRRHDWIMLVPEDTQVTPAVLATVPSVTEVSRTSLLCGRLQRGTADKERKGFAEHAGLLEHCRKGSPPILFHKPSLQESGDVVLAREIRHEIASSHRRVVGVVINAVDDHLLKGEQIDTRWSRDEITVLPSLLHEARAAGRLVVLLSDHGHILDHGTIGRLYEDGGERWRHDDGQTGEGELRLAGSRIVLPESGSLIAPWSESVRYGIKKNGYHGGITPQEMVVSVTVMAAGETQLKGWAESAVDLPQWWEGTRTDESEATAELIATAVTDSEFLFPVAHGDAATPFPDTAPPIVQAAEWINNLLSSPLFHEQKSLGGRAVPDDDTFGRLLSSLDRRSGKMTAMALARALGRPLHRLAGLLAVAQRVLNVDGYAVLIREEASDTVELNRELLCQQFDLD